MKLLYGISIVALMMASTSVARAATNEAGVTAPITGNQEGSERKWQEERRRGQEHSQQDEGNRWREDRRREEERRHHQDESRRDDRNPTTYNHNGPGSHSTTPLGGHGNVASLGGRGAGYGNESRGGAGAQRPTIKVPQYNQDQGFRDRYQEMMDNQQKSSGGSEGGEGSEE